MQIDRRTQMILYKINIFYWFSIFEYTIQYFIFVCKILQILINNIKEQQNLIVCGTMITDRSERSLSPLGKDPKSIGKLFKSKRFEEQNPELITSSSMFKNQSDNRQRSPKSIGINTPKAPLTSIPIITKVNNYENQNQVKPITHIKIKSPVIKITPSNPSKAKKDDKNTNNSYVLVNQNLVTDRVPAVVDFPISYYEQNQDGPQTPDLPNRMIAINNNSPKQASKQSPVIQMKKLEKQINTQYSQPGIIRHQNNQRVFSNSAPKDFGVKTNQSFQLSSPQLPYINKIQTNIQGFKKFVNTNQGSSQVASSSQMNWNTNKNYSELTKKYQINSSLSSTNNSPHLTRKSGTKSIGQIIKKNEKNDPEQEQKLEQKKNFRISNNNFYANRMKLPTFRQQNKEQFQQQVNLDIPINPIQSRFNKRQNYDFNNKSKNFNNQQLNRSSRAQKNMLSNSINQNLSYQQEEYQPGSLISNSFIRNTAQVQAQNLLIVDLRTSIQKIKQALIQGGQQMAVSFNIPDVFYKPPTSASTSQQLHSLMLEVFSYIGISPQIVSIKKYINCVVMREKKLCILWNFNGKIYFGGWKKQQTMSQGNKDGIGIQWVPSRYIYYGEFKDNKKQGYGLMKKSNKQIYIGCWKNNQRWGWGRVYDFNGNLHQNGQFIQGCFIYPQKGYMNGNGVNQGR